MKSRSPSIAAFKDPKVSGPFDPEQNPSKAAAFWLRRDIVRGVFAPTARLKVEELVQFYGVGHSPVREAILLNSSSGLIVHEHQKGYRVAPVSLADYDDVVGVYQRLYKLALGMAMERGGDDWEEGIVVQMHRSAKVPMVTTEGDPEARERWQRAYWEFHGALLSACGSPLMQQLLGDIGFRLERYVNLFADTETDQRRDHHAEHRMIVDAILARDRERTFRLIDDYFALGQPMRDSIIESLKRNAAGRRRRGAARPDDTSSEASAG